MVAIPPAHRRGALGVFLVLLGAYLATASFRVETIDTAVRLEVARSLVRDGTAALTYKDVTLQVELPIPATGPFGFLREAETKMPPKRILADHALTYRNLVVTTPDAPTRD